MKNINVCNEPKMQFNHESRKQNVLRSSSFSAAGYIISVVSSFLYRMIFLRILAVEYLGIDGLFTNILNVLGLAELGISNAIIYRLYKPLSAENSMRVGELMRFFRRAYNSIAVAILLLGCCVCPFLKLLISEGSTIPDDVNIYAVFLLLIIQTSSTYLFSYKFCLLNADQKQYQTTIIKTAGTLLRYTIQLCILHFTRNYTHTLISGISVTLLINCLGSFWVTKQYSAVFNVGTDITKDERKEIYSDTSAGLLHKIGSVVVFSTDNILLSKFIGLTVTGIYSNYAMIISGVNGVINIALGSLGPSLGNIHVTMSDKEAYEIYKKAIFLNFWISGLVGCCLYNLMDDFIILWVGKGLFLDKFTVSLLCIQFYVLSMRNVSSTYIEVSGLFKKDRMRPVIQSVLNLIVSVVLLKVLGTAGIFIGTIVSFFVTVFWREPYLLYKYVFHEKTSEYWKMYSLNFAVTVLAIWISWMMKGMIFGSMVSILSWLGSACICVGVFLGFHMVVFFRMKEYKYFMELIRNKHTAGRYGR